MFFVDTLCGMNPRGSPLPHVFVRFSALFLFLGFACQAQQSGSGPDKAKQEPPTAERLGASMPECTYCPPPEYSQEARKKRYRGVAALSVVVTREGTAADIRVLKTPGLGLEEKAIEAVHKWKFKPAMKNGAPVAVQAPVLLTFRL
jgi:periplasmic protein TonB